MTTLEVLMKARAEVEKGWCQHSLRDFDQNVCAVGALRRVNQAGVCTFHEFWALWQELNRLAPADTVQEFNDDPSTTKADVLAVFDRAINGCVPVGDSSHVHRAAA